MDNKFKNNIYKILSIIVFAAVLIGYAAINTTEPDSDIAVVTTVVSESDLTSESSGNSSEAFDDIPLDSDSASSQPSSSNDKNCHWGNVKTLQDHFDRHGGDFGASSPLDYAKFANDFYNNRENYLVKTDESGIKRIYDPETNSFGAYNKNGSTRSFFKPSGKQGYFDRQPGKLQE